MISLGIFLLFVATITSVGHDYGWWKWLKKWITE